MSGAKKATVVLVGGILLAAPAAARAESPAPPPAFERFKALAGEWLAAEDGEMVRKGEVVSRYAVTAAGSAVVETVFPGTPHEMVTVYHADGADLVLTHYCMSGNQPRMRAKAPGGRRLEFAFDGGSNLDPGRDRHMHSAAIEFLGPDELRSEWTEHVEGRAAGVHALRLLRKAR